MNHKDKHSRDPLDAWKAWLKEPRSRIALCAAAFIVCVAVGIVLVGFLTGDAVPAQPVEQAPQEEIVETEPTQTPDQPIPQDGDYNAEAEKLDTEKFDSVILAETEDAGQDYIDETLFIGDSNTARYMSYGHVTLKNGIGVIGMNSRQITSLRSVKFKQNSELITIRRAIPIMQPKRVIFAFGTNDVSGGVKSYIESYEKAIKKCYDEYPYFDIIISAVPPVDRYRDYNNITMQGIDKFNAALVEMCERNDWKFLNTTEVLKDKETGFCKTDYTIYDGIHLSKEGVDVVFDYIRTHAWETEDRRPKPLKDVPKRGETPPDLIVKDPKKPNGPHPSATPGLVRVVFKYGEGGTIQGKMEQQAAPMSVCQMVKAVPDEGYVFESWSSQQVKDVFAKRDRENPELWFTVPKIKLESNVIEIWATFTKAEPTATPEATASPEPTASPVPSAEPEVTATPVPEVTATPVPVPENTPEPVVTPAPEATPVPTAEVVETPLEGQPNG